MESQRPQLGVAVLVSLLAAIACDGETRVEHPFRGVTHLIRVEEVPRQVTMHVVRVDLDTPGLSFRLTPPGGSRETVRQTTLEFLREQKAQIAVNVHFFTPFPSTDKEAFLIGLAASDGKVHSTCEQPEQSYAILANAPAINIDAQNRASIVHCKAADLWNTVSGSAQIITNGVATIPAYRDGQLTPARGYSNEKSWYDVKTARTVLGLAGPRTLYIFTVDRAGGSLGMTLAEIADLLIRDYNVTDALNLDGGGSTTLAMEDPRTGEPRIVNVSSDNPNGRSVASSLAIFIH